MLIFSFFSPSPDFMLIVVLNSMNPPGGMTRPVRSSAAVHPQLVGDRSIFKGSVPTFQIRVVPVASPPGVRLPKSSCGGWNSIGGQPAGLSRTEERGML